MAPVFGTEDIDATGLRIAVAVAMFNDQITKRLCDGALQTAREHGALESDIDIFWVPGAFELPQIAVRLAQTGAYDAIACLGAVIRGETPHFEYVAGETARGLLDVALGTGIPVTFGVITADTLAQAEARAGGSVGNKGSEAMYAALHVASLYRRVADLDEVELEDDLL
jgi:6,7-dimethyl-8-ribityllumazine synthase